VAVEPDALPVAVLRERVVREIEAKALPLLELEPPTPPRARLCGPLSLFGVRVGLGPSGVLSGLSPGPLFVPSVSENIQHRKPSFREFD
jgi:hypothetical protein